MNYNNLSIIDLATLIQKNNVKGSSKIKDDMITFIESKNKSKNWSDSIIKKEKRYGSFKL